MATKRKGLLKGLKYICQIFEEEKEQEMQIGNPTDVKHVAHIGLDGPSVNAPNWMNQFQSASLSASDEAKANQEIQWNFEDSSRKSSRQNSSNKDLLDLPKSSNKDDSKSRSRRHSSDKSTQKKDSDSDLDSQSRSLPDILNKSRRKKNKDSDIGGASSLRSKKAQPLTMCSSPFSGPGPNNEPYPGPSVPSLPPLQVRGLV